MAYEYNELVTIGERFVTRSLTSWAQEILGTARTDLAVLKPKGVTDALLKGVDAGIKKVSALEGAQEKEKRDLNPLVTRRAATLEEALDWREELRGAVKAVFDSEPDALARFRTGVKLSASLPKVKDELMCLLPEVKAHAAPLKGVGIDEAFVRKGEALLGQVAEMMGTRAAERAETRPATEELRHAQGVLYTQVRFIVRRGQSAFRKQQDRASAYNYSTLRRTLAATRAAGTRAERQGAPA